MTAFVKSVEYAPITLTGNTAVSFDLTKSQTIENCVPFFTVNLTSDIGDIINRRYVEVYFEAGPKVTAKRAGSIGTVIVGVFVVEFDTSGDVSVEQGTWDLLTSETTTTETISSVTTTKAFCVISYSHNSGSDDWDEAQVAVTFNSGTELSFDRGNTPNAVTGRYYVVSTVGTDFAVLHHSLSIGNDIEEAEDTIASQVTSKTFIYSTYIAGEPAGDVRDGSIIVDLKDSTTIRARRAYNSFGSAPGSVISAASTMKVQIIEAQGTEFSVERAECDWGDSLTKAVTITEIDQTKAIVVPGGYQGTMSANETASSELDGNYAVLKFTSNTVMTGTRATNTSPDGTTFFEVVEFALAVVGGVVVNVPLHTYTLEDNQIPVIDIGVNIVAPLHAFTFNDNQTPVVNEVNILSPLQVFTLADNQEPIVGISVLVLPPAEIYTFQDNQAPVIDIGVNILPPLQAFTLADNQAPVVDIGVNILSPLHVFSFIQSIPTVDIGVNKLSVVVFADQNYYQPPFEIGAAKYGALCSIDFLKIFAMKTTVANPSDTDWSNQDGSITLAGSSAVKSLWVVEDGSDLHVATQQNNGRVAYHVFDPGTDTWTISDEQVATPGDIDFDVAPANPAVSLALRSDGDVVLVAAYNNISNEVFRVFTREAGSWTNRGMASITSTDSTGCVVVGPGSSDDIAWHFHRNLDTRLRGISSINVITGTFGIDATFDTALFITGPGINIGDDAYWPYIDASDKISVAKADLTDLSINSMISNISDNIVEGNSVTVIPFIVACLALNGITPILLYADDATQDLWKDGDASVGETDTEELDAVTVNRVSCKKGINDLLVFYNDAGTTKFLLISLATGTVINVPLQSYTLADNQIPIIKTGVNIAPPLQAFTFLDNQVPVVGTSVLVLSPVETYTFQDNQIPIVGAGASVAPPLHVFNFIPNTPQVGTSVLVLVPLEIFNLILNIPIVGSGVSIISPLQVFNLIPFIPGIGLVDIEPPTHIYTFDDNQIPQVGTSVLVIVPLQIFSLIDFIPGVSLILEIKSPLHIYSLVDFIPKLHVVSELAIDTKDLNLNFPSEVTEEVTFLFENLEIIKSTLEEGFTGQFTTTDGKIIHVRNGIIIDIFT